MDATNYSFYAVPAMWTMGIATHFYAIGLTKASNDLPDFDNVSPREFVNRVRKQEKQSPIVGKYLRAEAAQINTFENLGWFSAAVVAGNIARLPTRYLNLFAGGYLASRLLYTLLYVNTTSAAWSHLRSVTFVGGVASIMTTFIKAGNVFNKLVL
ncbi:hypothetical protein JCM21900_003242 [Sporobolomyces salmonicolor]